MCKNLVVIYNVYVTVYFFFNYFFDDTSVLFDYQIDGFI